MKNTIKMSLAAALAVSALSTSASAGNLEDAIKDVTISGKMEVEYDYSDANTANLLGGAAGADTTSNTWDIDFDVTAKIPVNDNITAVIGAEADTEEVVRSGNIKTGSTGDNEESTVNLTKTYFQYANGPVTAMVGKQGMAGAPWFDDERGNGVVAVVAAGPVAVAAANFTNVNGHALIQDETVNAAAVIAGDVAGTGINASVWYANVSNLLDSYTVNVNGKVADMIGFDVRHTAVSFEKDKLGAATDQDSSLTKAVISADMGMAQVRAGYGMTDDNTAGIGGLVNLESGDNDAATTFGLEQLNIADLNDANVYLIGAGATMGAVSVNLDYIDGDAADGTVDFNELFLQVDYAMSKNFTIGSHYSMAEVEKAESDVASVSLEYKF